MPANKKELSTPIQRFAKITAGFIGGYVLTQSFHMFLALCWDMPNAMITLRCIGFILWCVLLIFAFLAKNGWKVWGIYLALSLVFIALIYYKQPFTI